jgi:hypothetical protein
LICHVLIPSKQKKKKKRENPRGGNPMPVLGHSRCFSNVMLGFGLLEDEER